MPDEPTLTTMPFGKHKGATLPHGKASRELQAGAAGQPAAGGC
jgi:hypothetical protein